MFRKYAILAISLLVFTRAEAQTMTVNLKSGEKDVFEKVQRVDFQRIDDSHESVDLGLPSGTLWATMNLGAEKSEDYGEYFSWGETAPKSSYFPEDYKWCDNGQVDMCLKYNTRDDCGTVDNIIELEPDDDPATVLWGKGWCTPSEEQFRELINSNNTIISLENTNGVNVMQITSRKNGRVLLLPSAGDKCGKNIYYEDSRGNYWTRSLYVDEPWNATELNYYDGGAAFIKCFRYYGLTVRPVRK